MWWLPSSLRAVPDAACHTWANTARLPCLQVQSSFRCTCGGVGACAGPRRASGRRTDRQPRLLNFSHIHNGFDDAPLLPTLQHQSALPAFSAPSFLAELPEQKSHKKIQKTHKSQAPDPDARPQPTVACPRQSTVALRRRDPSTQRARLSAARRSRRPLYPAPFL